MLLLFVFLVSFAFGIQFWERIWGMKCVSGKDLGNFWEALKVGKTVFNAKERLQGQMRETSTWKM